MVVLQKYYEFVDKPTSEVSRGWKIWQILVYITAAISGYAIHFLLGDLKQQFGGSCILYPNISFVSKNVSEIGQSNSALDDDVFGRNALSKSENYFFQSNNTISIIDDSKTTWGNETLCDFCEYVPIMAMIIGTILLTFFTMCPKGGSQLSHSSGLKRPVHIVLPSLFITGIFGCIMLASAIKTKSGILAFCAEFEKVLNTTGCTSKIQQFAHKEATFLSNTSVDITILFILLSICVIAWFLGFAILFCRTCCAVADFKLMEVTISTVYDDEKSLEETEVLLEQNPTASPVSHV